MIIEIKCPPEIVQNIVVIQYHPEAADFHRTNFNSKFNNHVVDGQP